MTKLDYAVRLEHQIRNLSYSLQGIRSRLEGSPQDAAIDADLLRFGRRRDEIMDKLQSLKSEPDGDWTTLQAELDLEWDDLQQDFEERLGGMV